MIGAASAAIDVAVEIPPRDVTVPELLRSEVSRLAARPTAREWLERTHSRIGNNAVTTAEVNAALDEQRGPWPDAGS
jgi:hypothetical protein